MKTLETHHGGNWFDRLNNALAVDMDFIGTLAFAWDAKGPYFPQDYSLFYNGFVMLRLTFPLGIFIHLKFRRDVRSQFGLGWKLNGRFGAIFRPWHPDTKAMQGAHVNAPNLGQAAGWARGTA